LGGKIYLFGFILLAKIGKILVKLMYHNIAPKYGNTTSKAARVEPAKN
jgi:hypothetical protein